MFRLCLAAYEEVQYQRADQQMVAEGLLVSLPAPLLLPGETEEDDDFEPVEIPGKPLSEIILEDRRSCPPCTGRRAPSSHGTCVKLGRSGRAACSHARCTSAFLQPS